MIRINLMPFEERSQKSRRPQASRKSGGASGVLLPLAIGAGVLVLIVGTIVQQQAQLHMLTNEVARVERESQALAPQIAMVERLAHERADLDLRLSLIDQLSRIGGAGVEPEDALDEVERAGLLAHPLGAPVHLDVRLLELSDGGAHLLLDGLSAARGPTRLLLGAGRLRLERDESVSRDTTFTACRRSAHLRELLI